MTEDKVYSKWSEYMIRLGAGDPRTAEAMLVRFGFVMPDRGAPIIRESLLAKKMDEHSVKK